MNRRERRAAKARGDTIITGAGAREARLALVNRMAPQILEVWRRSPESGIADPCVVVADPADSVGERFMPQLPSGAAAPKPRGPFVGLVSRSVVMDLLRETNDHGEDVDGFPVSPDGLFLVCIAHEGSTFGEVVIRDGRLLWGRPKDEPPPSSPPPSLN